MATATSTHRAVALQALRRPRGRYLSDRASQLSGVPRSTIYDWHRAGVYHPDFGGASPMAWSYRDLVFIRLLAWLRQRGLDRPVAAARVEWTKSAVAGGEAIVRVSTDGTTFLVNDEVASRFEGDEDPLPFEELHDLIHSFDIADPISELGTRRLWGPDLVTPSPHTTITAWVMAGEPCVAGTRIPTAALFALRHERALGNDAIVRLYPGLTDPEVVGEAIALEERLRRAA